MKIVRLTDTGMELYTIGREIDKLKSEQGNQYERSLEENERKALLFYQTVNRMGFQYAGD